MANNLATTWIVPHDIHERERFGVDDHFGKFETPTWWLETHPLGRPRTFARRALEVAIRRAATEKQKDLANSEVSLADYEKMEKLAKSAVRAAEKLYGSGPLEKLLRHLQPDYRSSEDIAHGLWQLRAQPRPGRADQEDAAQDLEETRLAAESDARTLTDLVPALKRVCEDTQAGLRKVKGVRKFEGRADRAAFVLTLAEAWSAWTGKRPPISPEPRHNRFLQMVEAAWVDAGQAKTAADITENWKRPLDAARAQLPSAKIARWHQLGPDWK